MKLAVLVSNRGFFPGSVIASAHEEMKKALESCGVEALELPREATKYGAVETTDDGRIYADFLKEHAGEYDGLIICLPNFGDENGIKAAIKDVTVPILLQAYPDEFGKMDFANRRDAFCGKLGLCAVLKQMKVKFVSGEPFVMHPLSAEFKKELTDFIEICRVVKGMRRVRLGVMGARTTAFKSVRFDEGAMESLGIDTETLDETQVFAKINSISDNDPRLESWKKDLLASSNTCDTPAYAILNQCKLGVALEELYEEMHLDVMAIRCWSELQYEYKIAPCAIMGLLNQRKMPIVCETDASNAPAMLALTLASDSGTGCLDVNNNYGNEADKCILFHCGPLPMDLLVGPGHMEEHKMFTKTQGENCSWGVNVGKIKPGTITICGMRTENGQLRYFVEKGEIIDAPVDEGFFGTYGILKMDNLQTKLRHMAEEGFRHHALITTGDHVRSVQEALSKYLGYTEIKL